MACSGASSDRTRARLCGAWVRSSSVGSGPAQRARPRKRGIVAVTTLDLGSRVSLDGCAAFIRVAGLDISGVGD